MNLHMNYRKSVIGISKNLESTYLHSLRIKINNFKYLFVKNELKVSYSGTVPNLFAEQKGVVAEGKLQDKTFFIADRILAKHDENYMPPELKNIKQNA